MSYQLNIGDVRISSPFALAPMAGVNCTSFRILCKENGAGLIYTQMYHAEFIIHKYEEEGMQAVKNYINLQPEERPVSVQLVGSSPEKMAIAAEIVSEFADIVDINFGCCDPNMISANCGGWFSKNPDKMIEVAKAVVSSSKRPVTAKIRIGWDSQSLNAVKVAQDLEKTGISALAVHGRTVVQKYGGKANWTIIKQIKDKLSIPIIGNGDANNSQNAIHMMEQTGCDMVMIGRRAMGDPTIFARCMRKYTKDERDVPDVSEEFKKFIDYYSKYDHDKSFTELRTHALWFGKRAAIGPRKREKIALAKTSDEIKQYFFE